MLKRLNDIRGIEEIMIIGYSSCKENNINKLKVCCFPVGTTIKDAGKNLLT